LVSGYAHVFLYYLPLSLSLSLQRVAPTLPEKNSISLPHTVAHGRNNSSIKSLRRRTTTITQVTGIHIRRRDLIN